MIKSTYFKINSSQVAHETIEGEVVVIHLQSGVYYSLQNVGASVWNLIETGATVSETIEGITHQYDGDAHEIESTVKLFVSELQKENLIEPDTTKQDSRHETFESITEKLPFETPVLQKYEDMQDLLMLDPIHEVDETGWPNVRSQIEI